MFSAAKASERAGAWLVSPAKNRIKWSHFGANYLLPCRVCCRVRVSSRAVKVCQNKQITEKIPIRESKQRNVQYKKQVMNKSAVLWYLGVQSQDVSGSLQGLHTPWKEKNVKKKLCSARTQNKTSFFATWLPGKSDLSKVLKWRKIKRPLQLCLWIQAITENEIEIQPAKKYTVQLKLDQNSSRHASRRHKPIIGLLFIQNIPKLETCLPPKCTHSECIQRNGHSYNSRNSKTFYFFPARTNIRLFDIRFQGPKFFTLLNRNIQSAVSPFLSLAESSLVNIICFLLIFVPLEHFALLAFYPNLFFNTISPPYHYFYSHRLERELTVIWASSPEKYF